MKEQVFNGDETGLLCKNVVNESIEYQWMPKLLAFNHLKIMQLTIFKNYVLNEVSLRRNTLKTTLYIY